MPDQYNRCDKENIVSQLLKVQAQITVTPLVKHGNPNVYCMNSCIKPNSDYCDHECDDCNDCDYDCCDCCDCGSDYDTDWKPRRTKDKCNFTLTQVICIEIPISIDADVDIQEGIVCCGRPDVKSIDDINKKKQFYMQMI